MPNSRSLSVLIVEDNPDSADTLAALVELYGHSPLIAHGGLEAVRLARESSPDVVILDVGLPDADGYAVAAMLCRMLERRPLLVVTTGYHHMAGRSRAAGIDHHFTKPIEPSVLEHVLRQHVEKVEAVLTG